MKHINNNDRTPGQKNDHRISDGSGIAQDGEYYDSGDYLNFVSNDMSDNEKVEAVDYFEEFLTETRLSDDEFNGPTKNTAK